MRNILCLLLSVLVFMMASCSGDDITPAPAETDSTPVLVTKIIEIANGESEKISEYFYEGTTITHVSHNDSSHEEFLYNNNRISSIRHYENEELIKEDFFEYDSAGILLKIKTLTANGWEWGERYTYDSFGANIEYYMIEPGTEHEMLLSISTSISIENSNIISSLTGDSLQRSYFDEKNNPFINVAGFNILTLSYALPSVGINNVISSTQSYGPASATTYSYNSDGFPVTSLKISEDGQEVSKQYFYNQ